MAAYKILIAAIVALSLLAMGPGVPVAVGQTSMATLRGTITDEQGGVVPGATITARHVATNTALHTTSSDAGLFYLSNLPAGAYEVTAELSGFVTNKRSLDLRVGQELTVAFTLAVAGLTTNVEVVGESRLIATQNTVGTVIDQRMIDDLPILSRDFAELAKLAPGTTQTGTTGTGAGSGVSIGGARPTSNGIVVDGASNAMQFYGRQANEFPQDWIQEFQVHTNAFGAEYGQAAGGLLNVITRSGSNRFSGRAYGFFRDNVFDKAPFAGRFANGEPVFLDDAPAFHEDRYGGMVGGPIKKDNLFFFVGVQNLDQDASDVLGVSEYWRQNGVTATAVPTGVEDLAFLAKADWNATRNNRLTMRYTNTDKADLGRSLNNSPLDTAERRYTFTGPLWNVMGNLATTLGNSSFNELRLFYGRNLPWIISDLAGAGGSELLRRDGNGGQNGTFASLNYPGANFGATGFTGLEGETNFTIINNFSFVKGRHQVKLGAQLSRLSMHMDVEAPHKGSFTFLTDRVFNINDPTSYPSSFSGGIGDTTGEYPAWNPSLFFQDTWQPTDSLTLNMGLRYDLDRTPLVLNDRIPPYNDRIIARFGGEPPLRASTLDTNNIAPRFGVVWTPTESKRTAIRGSSGIFYNQNHFNWTVIYAIETLQTERRFQFNANNPEQNPFWNPANIPAGQAALRAFLAQNFPAFPDVSRAALSAETILGVDPDFKIPYSLHLTGGATHSFESGISLSADYTFRYEFDAPTGRNFNYELVNGVYRVKDPRFGRISLASNGGFIRYNGLLTRVEYRRWARAQVGASYTLSKTLSNTSTGLSVGGTTNPFDLSEDLGPDDNDRRHNFVLDGSLQGPWGLQLAGIWAYRSALPYSVSTAFQLDSDPFPDRPELRNSRRGDSENTVDLRLSKTFNLGRGVSATGFWEIFNLFNVDNFLRYQGSLESPAFGLPLTQLPKQRQQLGFRLEF